MSIRMSASPPPPRTLTTSTTEAATAEDQVLTTLWTFTLPAGTLAQNGRGIRVTVVGKLGDNTNTKNLFVSLGGDSIFSRSNATAGGIGFSIQVWAIRISATTYLYGGMANIGTSAFSMVPASASETFANALAVAFKGQNGTAAAADIVFQGAVLELI